MSKNKQLINYTFKLVLGGTAFSIIFFAILIGASRIYADFESVGKPLHYVAGASLSGSTTKPMTIIRAQHGLTVNTGYKFKKKSAKPNLTAAAYLVADLDTGELILSKNYKAVHPIASVTKLMTSLVAQDLIVPNKTASVSRAAVLTYGNRTAGKFKVGEKILVKDLYYPLLLESSNSAAEVFAEQAGRSYFIGRMNDKARELGLDQTSFEDPSGLSPHNVSSPEDLFTLARYIYQEHKDLLEISKLQNYKAAGHYWHNKNRISLMSSYLGGKNGYTDEAGKTIVSLFSVPLVTGNRNIAIILLKSDNLTNDISHILGYLKRDAYYSEKEAIFSSKLYVAIAK
jgi:D-alanyl-D-alanine carboxypeptidase